LTNPAQLPLFLPELKVTGDHADRYVLQRYYFRFKPIAVFNQGKVPEAFIEDLKAVDLGPYAIIDLGGEIEKSREFQTNLKGTGVRGFEDSFIRQYVNAKGV